MKTKVNLAYVDGQNLYMGTAKSAPKWHINLARFRRYLADKYHVVDAYYYLGFVQTGEEYDKLYESSPKSRIYTSLS